MDNLTHTLCGWAIARAGFREHGGWAAPLAVLSANLPDIDILFVRGQPKAEYLIHHRGLSHSVLGVAAGVLLVAMVTWLAGQLLKRRLPKPPAFLPVLAVAGLAAFSHLVLDLFTSYGFRPWLPFADTWYYLDTLFIVDPWLWLILGAAVYLGGRWRQWGLAGWLMLALAAGSVIYSSARAGLTPYGVPAIWALLACAVAGVSLWRKTDEWLPRAARWGLAAAGLYIALLFVVSREARALALAEHHRLEAGALTNGEWDVSVSPAAGVPWRCKVLIADTEAVRSYEVSVLSRDAQRAACFLRGLDDPALAGIRDSLEYRAWRTFARHPIAERRGERLVLGDARYRLLHGPDWSELSVPLR